MVHSLGCNLGVKPKFNISILCLHEIFDPTCHSELKSTTTTTRRTNPKKMQPKQKNQRKKGKQWREQHPLQWPKSFRKNQISKTHSLKLQNSQISGKKNSTKKSERKERGEKESVKYLPGRRLVWSLDVGHTPQPPRRRGVREWKGGECSGEEQQQHQRQ